MEIEKKLRNSQVHEDKLTAILSGIKENQKAVENEMSTKIQEFKNIHTQIAKCLKTIENNLDYELESKRKKFDSDRGFYHKLLDSLNEDKKYLSKILQPLRLENNLQVQKSQEVQRPQQKNPPSISLFDFDDQYFQKGINAMAYLQNAFLQIQDCVYTDYYPQPKWKDANLERPSYLANIFAALHEMILPASMPSSSRGHNNYPGTNQPARRNSIFSFLRADCGNN